MKEMRLGVLDQQRARAQTRTGPALPCVEPPMSCQSPILPTLHAIAEEKAPLAPFQCSIGFTVLSNAPPPCLASFHDPFIQGPKKQSFILRFTKMWGIILHRPALSLKIPFLRNSKHTHQPNHQRSGPSFVLFDYSYRVQL
jgi:hypothetical protein